MWQDAQPVASSPAWFIGELGPQAVNDVFVIARVWQVSQAVMTVSGMWVVGDDDVPLANEPLWHEAQPVASSPAWFIGEFGPQAAKLFVIASVWQLSHAAVPIGIWVVGADDVPLASVPLWQDAQPVAGSPAWLIGEFGPQAVKLLVTANVWHVSQAAVVGMWPPRYEALPSALVSLWQVAQPVVIEPCTIGELGPHAV